MMSEWLIRRFAAGDKNGEGRGRVGVLAGAVAIACNLLLVAVKVLTAIISGSVAVMADAVNNLSDAASGIISLMGFRLAGKPADREHPFGHARYEYLAGLTVAVIVMVIGVELMKTSANKIMSPEPTVFSWLAAGILAASILTKVWLSGFYRKAAGLINSGTLLAAAADSRNDVISTSAVLLSLVIEYFFKVRIDIRLSGK